MKRVLSLLFSILILFCMMFGLYVPSTMAATISDGTYVVEYNMLQAENDSVSIANDYFEKPATLTVENGEQYLQFTVNHSEWVKVLKAAHSESFVDVHVVSEDPENDKRVVAFKVDGDLSESLPMQMHIMIEEMAPVYDHNYSVRIVLDIDSMEVTDVPSVVFDTSDSTLGSDDEKVQGNSTNNKALIYILVAVFAIATLVLGRKFKSTKK